MSRLYQRIREARRGTGLTQEALALELGVTRSAVAQWEMVDGTAPSMENLMALARRSGLHFEYLATGRGARNFGPAVAAVGDTRADYRALDPQQQQLLEQFETLTPRQKAGLLDLLDTGTRGRQRRRS